MTNLNIRQAKNNIGSRLELCSWPPAVLKSNIRLALNSTLVNNYSGRRLCLSYTRVANLAPFAAKPCEQIFDALRILQADFFSF